MTIWLTPAGTFDEGGVEQPAYLNFDIALLAPPAAYKMEVRGLPSPARCNSLVLAASPSTAPHRDHGSCCRTDCFRCWFILLSIIEIVHRLPIKTHDDR